MAYRRKHVRTWFFQLSTPGGVVRLTTGTTDKATANAIERAVKDLVIHREKAILDALLGGTIAAGDVFDAARTRTMDALRARHDDVNLEPHVSVFRAPRAKRRNGYGCALRARRALPDLRRHAVSSLRLHRRQAGLVARSVPRRSCHPS
jgi:hypothetical protein